MISYWEVNEQDIRQGRGNMEELSLTINAIQYDDTKPKRTKKDMLNQIIDEMEGKAKKDCYSTGLIMLDRNMGGGMHKGEMMTIAAETGGGKSILLVQAIVANILEGKSCLFFSLEMSGEDIYRRLAANIAGVPVREMEDYKVNYGRELPAITEALTKLYSLPIEVIDFMHDMDSIESEIARAASENRADVIAVDYIQILNMNDSDNRETAISEAARRLKTLAAKHKSVLFTASQVNDEGRLRESRAIGMHLICTWLLHLMNTQRHLHQFRCQCLDQQLIPILRLFRLLNQQLQDLPHFVLGLLLQIVVFVNHLLLQVTLQSFLCLQGIC